MVYKNRVRILLYLTIVFSLNLTGCLGEPKKKISAMDSLLSRNSKGNLTNNKLRVCLGCHGVNFDKNSPLSGRKVKNMSREDIITALHAYKSSDTYGIGPLKGWMKYPVSKLSDEEINALATIIKTYNFSKIIKK